MEIKKDFRIEEYKDFLKENFNSVIVTGSDEEISKKLFEILSFLKDKYDIYFITEGIELDEDSIDDDLKKNICFTISNEKNIINPYRSLHIEIKSNKNILSAIKCWENSFPEQRTFSLLHKKTKVYSVLDTYQKAEMLIFTIFEYDDYGFYILYDKDINLSVLLD